MDVAGHKNDEDAGILAQLEDMARCMLLHPLQQSPGVAGQCRGPTDQLILDACVLCGCIMIPGMDRRYKQAKTLADLVRRRCYPTPFAYLSISSSDESDGDRKACCCIACINWVRRLGGEGRGRGQRLIPIPIDNLLLFLHCPGTAAVRPDQRSLHRMMCSLANLVVLSTAIHTPLGLNASWNLRSVQNTYLKFCTPMIDR